MSNFLNQQIADALCTIILAGYIKVEGSAKANFQYADDAERNDYSQVQTRLQQFGVALNISQSRSQADMPYIVAKTPRVATTDYAQLLTQEYWKYLQAITKSANQLATAPYGAYIGGMSTTSSLFIIGPSALDQYAPQYRSPDNGTVKTAYDKAVKATNDSLGCIRKDTPVSTPKGIKLDFTGLNNPITTPFQDGKLFKSYHGMIQSMVKYQTQIDGNSFMFEIALGTNTSKVSSCFPCCIFMTACDTPPTSTHLGRGDNWNIPQGSYKREAWEKKINQYYTEGTRALGGNPNVAAAARAMSTNNVTSQMPAVFLEALTFESKFTQKITNTLG